jgi:hypothetical protein
VLKFFCQSSYGCFKQNSLGAKIRKRAAGPVYILYTQKGEIAKLSETITISEKQGLCFDDIRFQGKVGMGVTPYLYTMEWTWIILGIILTIIAIAGSVLPLLPGPPIAYVGLLLQQLRTDKPFTTKFLIFWAAVVVLSMILDYLVPIWGTKKFGGTKYGVWGCTLGFIAAFWLGPWGVVIGPLIGAFIGEMIAQDSSRIALKAAFGSFVGFLLGSFLKLVICFFMLYHVVASI